MSQPEGTRFHSPGESPGYLLWRATHRWQREITRALTPLGLTHVQFVLLASSWWLAGDQPLAPTQREIAEHAGTDPMMTSQVLRGLEARGLITRERDPSDGRSRRIAPTEDGSRLARRAIAVVVRIDVAFFAGSDPEELLRMLTTLAHGGGGSPGPLAVSGAGGLASTREANRPVPGSQGD